MSENCETCKNQRVLYYYGEVCICADCSDDMKLSDYIKQLQEENKLLRECVEFYADPDNECCGDYQPPNKARKTLAKIKGDV